MATASNWCLCIATTGIIGPCIGSLISFKLIPNSEGHPHPQTAWQRHCTSPPFAMVQVEWVEMHGHPRLHSLPALSLTLVHLGSAHKSIRLLFFNQHTAIERSDPMLPHVCLRSRPTLDEVSSFVSRLLQSFLVLQILCYLLERGCWRPLGYS